MGSTPLDSAFFKDLFGTDEMRAIFEERNQLQRWLDVEAALARVEGRLGVVPQEAADAIVAHCNADEMSIEAIKRDMDVTRHPIVPVIKELERHCPGDSGEYIHWGATTQDIMDTGMVLQLKEALPILMRDLGRVEQALMSLAKEHRGDADGGADAWTAGVADHIRVQGGSMGGRDGSAHSTDEAMRAATAGWAVQWWSRDTVIVRGAGVGGAGCADGRSGTRQSRHYVAFGEGQPRRVCGGAFHDSGQPGENDPRSRADAANRDGRTGGEVRAGAGGEQHNAPEAEPDLVGAGYRSGPDYSGAGRRCAGRAGARGRARLGGVAQRMALHF